MLPTYLHKFNKNCLFLSDDVQSGRVIMLCINPFKPNGISHCYQLDKSIYVLFVCLMGFILYVPSTIFQLCRDGSSWVEPVLS